MSVLSRDQLKSQTDSLGRIGWGLKKIQGHFVSLGLATSKDTAEVFEEINEDIRKQNAITRQENREFMKVAKPIVDKVSREHGINS